MGFKDALKNVGSMALEKTKEAVDTKIQDIEQNRAIKKEERLEDKALKSIFSPTKKIGDLQVDMNNKLFRIKNSDSDAYKKKSGIGDKVLTVYTLGTNKLVSKALKSSDQIYNFNDLLDFELLEDDISIASGGLGRAAVGAVAFGGVGAIVGSVTGKKVTKKKITQLILKISLNDVDCPCIMLPYITKPTSTSSKEYQEAFNEAHQVLAMLNVIANNSMLEENIEDKQTVVDKSIPDNLEQVKKLKELLDLGAITQEEFDIKKKELLGI